MKIKSKATPHGRADMNEMRAAVKMLKSLYPKESRAEIERVVWSFLMGNPKRKRRKLVAMGIDVLSG